MKKTLVYFILLVGAAISLLPFLWMAAASFTAPENMFSSQLMPQKFTLQNYVALFKAADFLRFFLNSSLVAVITVLLGLFFDALAGFAFAKYRFPGRNGLFVIVLATLMIPSQITLIPSYIILSKLGLVNTLTGIIISAVVSAFGIFLMRQYIRDAIPDELIEAARIDGHSEISIFFRIILPLARPALGALAIFRFLASWNNYLWPLIVLNDPAKFTLPVGIAMLQGAYGTPIWGLQMAGALLATLPVLILFLFFQRYFISGISLGAVKE